MDLRAVFLDFGGTLARSLPQWNDPSLVWMEVGARFGLSLTREALSQALHAVDPVLAPKIYDYVGRTDEYWHLYDTAIMDHLGIRDRREELEVALSEVFNDLTRIEPYPETLEALRAVRPKVRHLGVISNHHDRLLDQLRYHGLDLFFDSITYSQEAGAEKPDPAIFHRALERAGCAPREAMHVGDSFAADVVGARAVGITPVWLTRKGETSPSPCTTIRDLSELSPLVDRLVREA